MNSRIKRGLQIAVLGGGMWALSAGTASADTPVATPPGVTSTNPTNATDVAGNNTGNGAQPTTGRSDATSLTGVAGLNLSSTSTGLGNNQSTDRGNRSSVLGNYTGNGAQPTTGRSDATSLTGVAGLNLSSTSTDLSNGSNTDRSNRSNVIGNNGSNTGNGATRDGLLGGDRSNTGNSEPSSFTGGLALGLSSTSTNRGGNRLL